MATLEEATDRLQKALARLEAAARNSGDPRLAAGSAGGTDADIQALRNENSDLQAAVDQVSGRLDQTIEHLQKILEA